MQAGEVDGGANYRRHSNFLSFLSDLALTYNDSKKKHGAGLQ